MISTYASMQHIYHVLIGCFYVFRSSRNFLPSRFLTQTKAAVQEIAPTDEKAESERSANGVVTTAATSTAPATSGSDAGVKLPTSQNTHAATHQTVSAEMVSAFCRANTRCRNFTKGVGASGSADLVLVRHILFRPTGWRFRRPCLSL